MPKQQAETPKDQGPRLVDVIEMVRANPPRPRVVREEWTEARVAALPLAPVDLLAPVPAFPGAAYKTVPEGSPMSAAAVLQHNLTCELMEVWERRAQFELRDQRIADEQRRLAELDEMQTRIVEKRAQAVERIAELEAVEPVEPVDWSALAARIVAVSRYDPIPFDLGDDNLQLSDAAALRGGLDGMIFGPGGTPSERYERVVGVPAKKVAAAARGSRKVAAQWRGVQQDAAEFREQKARKAQAQQRVSDVVRGKRR